VGIDEGLQLGQEKLQVLVGQRLPRRRSRGLARLSVPATDELKQALGPLLAPLGRIPDADHNGGTGSLLNAEALHCFINAPVYPQEEVWE
jgi:hypothetical protein